MWNYIWRIARVFVGKKYSKKSVLQDFLKFRRASSTITSLEARENFVLSRLFYCYKCRQKLSGSPATLYTRRKVCNQTGTELFVFYWIKHWILFADTVEKFQNKVSSTTESSEFTDASEHFDSRILAVRFVWYDLQHAKEWHEKQLHSEMSWKHFTHH